MSNALSLKYILGYINFINYNLYISQHPTFLSLNMNHDDDDKCMPYVARHNNNKVLHIMSSVMGIHMHPWSWSKCSRHFVSEFLE